MTATAELPLACACTTALFSSACTRSDHLLLGRIEATAAATGPLSAFS